MHTKRYRIERVVLRTLNNTPQSGLSRKEYNMRQRASSSRNGGEEGKRVGLFIRVSTEDQARGESPEHHEARARMYAEAKGWTPVTVYDLAGVSGKSVMEHPEVKRM